VVLIASLASAEAAPDDNKIAGTVYLTAKGTPQRLAEIGQLHFDSLPQPEESQETIFVDSSKTFQNIVGIGGALTDAAAETFYRLPAEKQHELLTAYFDPAEGIGYSLGRTHINSCDFSSESYAYVRDGDKELASFNIAHDLKCRIPFIKQAVKAAGKDFSLFVSPWSPPAWMKDNHDMLQGGHLLPQFFDAWANYYVKFIQAYQKEGIPIWGLTVQNEPMSKQTWESCIYSAEDERGFLKNHLGPALARAKLSDKKVMIWDHNRNLVYQRAKEVLDDPSAAKYVWGVAYHWYVGDHFENLKLVKEAYPRINLLFSEGCNGPFDRAGIDDWQWGERYGRSMINDFNQGAAGWTDWNVLLDERGGPNHVGNFCFAPIHADTNGALHYMNSYYYIGHFSKFIRPGPRRIVSSSTSDDLLTTAFINKDGRVAVVVMNSTGTDHHFYLWWNRMAAKCNGPAHSILTVLLSNSSNN
jgi:glucosylceramidase